MHIVAVGWLFVVVLLSLAEATSPQGTLLGAFFTLLLYGVLPLSIVLYVMGSSARKRARQTVERAEPSSPHSDGCGQPAGDALTAERKES